MAKTKKGLGRGLDVLFSDNTVETQEDTEGKVMQLRLSQLEPCSDQPREDFDEESLQQLADSIKEHGIISPLVVRPLDGGIYQIVAGERRWRAARMAGLLEVPAVIREYDELERAVIALVENLQREDLNPLEEAKGYSLLMKEHGMTQEEVAKQVGKSRPAVANSLRIMQLPEDVQELVMAGTLTAGHARALVPLGEKASDGARKVISGSLSVRETEKLVARMEREKEQPKKPKKDIVVNYYEEIERELSEKLGLKARIHPGKKKKKLEIEFYSDEDLNRLTSLLEG